ncbi:MAG: BlaI/MecI/CopY family transcriptional regulator [Gemmatimonadetes bacterium]|jgi:predicted transcriptional regulator|nr:BlaI/MecI/CopY family transcriptional regulator [Gemmatimonadota bacterium]MBP6670105.1 BlaI/MecI/CopY family transcriptional regulator [Gemmatimonadales bacterium]MBK6781412.1 BlaI/MecI/CopY family transcriptional regulator [Gemmatimonadota bacterium]MBK7784470.1 BlaI/MecI/CopY family transcriptional regulator [Gemmatimonadota bacterium]MBK7925408.1 BlaI/MecI/CopY family transcriptional regulator [Gemmatimonadota bacterium]
MSDIHQLTELQIAILRVLWERGQATVADICEALRPERGLALTTVATLLSRLEKRGVVAHETRARQYVYHPLVTEADVRHSMVRELTEQLFDGNVAALVSHLLSEREISPGDLDRVRAMLEQAQAGKGGDSDAQ